MSDLPDGWIEVPLGKVAITQLGRMLSSRRETGAHAKPYLRNRDVQWGHINTDDLPVMDFTPKDAGKFALQHGDVLVCEGGEVGRAAIWHGQLAECYYQKALHRIRVSEALLPEFLAYLLEHYARSRAFERYISGSTIAHLPQEDLRELPIPLPPVLEQGRIVAAIEEQFSRLDTGVSAVIRAQRRLLQLRNQGILALVTGKGAKVRLGEVCDIRLGRQRSPKNHIGPDMVPYLRAANVTWDGLDLTDVKQMNFSSAEVSTYRLRRGDVLVAEASGSASEVGKPAIWDESISVCCFQNTLLRLRSDKLLPEYLYFVLLALARNGTFARASKGVGIHHLSKAGLANLMIETPSIERQRELVAAIIDQQEHCASLGTAISIALKRANRLRSSILETAYSGKLVPTEPTEEAASLLLEPATAERASSNGRPTQDRKHRVVRRGVTS